jgi:hypothetical protein
LPLPTAEEQQRVDAAVNEWLAEGRGPYARWLGDLAYGRSRLPVLRAEAMRELLLAWLSPQVDMGCVCKQCGLEYPHCQTPPISQWQRLAGKTPGVDPPPWYDLPVFFAVCPYCGAPGQEFEWAHLVGDGGRAWQQLDGYVAWKTAR